jgi:hypothetical protein
MIAMPGRSYFGQPIQPSLEELRVAVDLHKDVVYLAGAIGERNLDRYNALQNAARYIEESLKALGYNTEEPEYVVEGLKAKNISVEIRESSLPPRSSSPRRGILSALLVICLRGRWCAIRLDIFGRPRSFRPRVWQHRAA